jgi:3-deoxy-D-manno-octulosonic-acid transferase
MLFPYTFALWLLMPYVFLRLVWRARKQPEYLQHIGERFGFYSLCSNKPLIWLHAVSVGETRATQSLVSRLRENFPHHQILLTHSTPTGRSAGEQLFGDSVLRVYLPYDYPFAVKRFLRHFQPQLGMLMETEIWFNLIHACHQFHVPLLLLNGRMSEKSWRGYARFAYLTHRALTELTAIAAQTKDDAARFSSLGATNVTVTGNLKFEIDPPSAMLELGRKMRGQFGVSRRVLLASSTRNGEEALLLDALENIHIPGLLLVIVPRHPQRFAVVASLLEQRGISFLRRSKIVQTANPDNGNAKNTPPVPPDVSVVLGDSMGEMFAYYAAADLAFIGGSLLPFGGQNLIESCAVGTPVLLGPHMYNFAEASRLAVAAGAAIQASNVSELVIKAQQLFENAEKLDVMRRQCTKFVEANRGATEQALQLASQHLNMLTHPDSLLPARFSR